MKTGQMWTRVTGPNLHPQNAVKAASNTGMFESPSLKEWCNVAGIQVTKRQASKWNNKKGAAYKLANSIEMNGFVVPAV